MFSDILVTSTIKLTEVKELVNYINNATPPAPHNPEPVITAMKGLFFVHLYGVYEYTIKSTIVRTIESINSSNVNINDCKIILSSLILNDYYNSISNAGDGKKWEKRWDMLNTISNNIKASINVDLMPTDGKNFRHRQLNSIWTSFGITDDIYPRNEIGGRIDEIVELRNLIAHGNETPFEIGKRFTVPDLTKRYDDISEYCTYFISVFESYITRKGYLNNP